MSSVIVAKASVILVFKFVISGTGVENTLCLTYPHKKKSRLVIPVIVVARVSDHLSLSTCLEMLHPKIKCYKCNIPPYKEVKEGDFRWSWWPGCRPISPNPPVWKCCTKKLNITNVTYPHIKKSKGVISGDLGGQGVGPSLPIHLFRDVASKNQMLQMLQ